MSAIHYEDQSHAIWGSVHYNENNDSMVAVRVYVPAQDPQLLPLDELRLTHQALLAAAADVLDSISDLVGARETA